LPCFTESGFTIIGLHPQHSDYWADKLDLSHHEYSELPLDNEVTRFFARTLQLGRYALIHTDYFGVNGQQQATVIEGERVLLPVMNGGINAALRLLGVRRGRLTDEFDTIRLGTYRSFEDYFARYYEDSD